MEKFVTLEYATEDGERKIFEVIPLSISQANEFFLIAKDVKTCQIHTFLFKNICRVFDENTQRILCVTIYVMNEEKKFLLLLHKKLGRWLPPGGKVDGHETPDQAAVRECFEETGVRVELCSEKTPVEGGLFTPIGSQLNTIVPGKRDHVDLIYLAKPLPGETLLVSEREADAIGWFTLEEIEKLHTFPSVVQWCRQLALK